MADNNKYSTKPRPGIGYLIVYSDMQDSPAFNAMQPLAQLLVMKAKRFYDRTRQGPVPVSARTAAKLIGTSKDTALSHCREAVHHGCWRNHTAGHLGSNGRGIAATYQLTDEMFRGKPATLDFLRWDGTPFHEARTPAYDRRQERSLARLKARKPSSSPQKKTESRPRHTGHPVPDTQDTPVLDTQAGSPKIQQNPVLDIHHVSRESSQFSAASELVDVSQGAPVPAPEPCTPAATQMATEPEPSAVDGDDMSDNKQEQDLISMIEVLRTFLGNRATSGQWYKQMQTYGGAGWLKGNGDDSDHS